jgi:capsular polysaccharide transport system permease protein
MEIMKKPTYSLLTIGASIALSALYLFGVTQDRFASESRFTVKAQNEGIGGGVDLGILGGTSSKKQDQLIIRDYLRSFGVMQQVEAKFGRTALSSPSYDPLYSLKEDSDDAKRLSHYRKMVNLAYDDEAGISKIEVQAFNAKTAMEINTFLMSAAETYINEYSERSMADFISSAERDLLATIASADDIRAQMRDAQRANRSVSPQMDIEVASSTIGNLERQLVSERADLTNMATYLKPDTYQIKTKQELIVSLEGQIESMRNRLADDSDGESAIGEASLIFNELTAKLELAMSTYASAQRTLELTKTNAAGNRKYLMVIERPSSLNVAIYPNRISLLLASILAIMFTYLNLLGARRIFLGAHN